MSRIAQSFLTLYYGLYALIKLCYALLADLIRHQFGVAQWAREEPKCAKTKFG